MNVILLAPPAAGKGTQAEILTSIYNLDHISTGDLLRNAANDDSIFGKELKQIMESGNLVSDDIVLEVLNRHLDTIDSFNLLLDGFPRNIYQAEKLDEILGQKNSKIDYVFLLNVPKDILLFRITGRRLCKNCGKVYNVNIASVKPEREGVCDICGGELFVRHDDNESTFNTRYDEYLKQTSPLIDYYKQKGILYEIDSSVDRDDTFAQIKKILEKTEF